jgi:oligoribonuclease NrnB/cAMP/cGMP phosphodiesterase (DHH superfamily)
MWKPDICFYHFPCDDGFAAAWTVKQRWPDIDLRPTNYGLEVPDAAIDGKNILIADFSFKPPVLESLAARAASIIILDHHKTAQADLKEFLVEMCGDAAFTAEDADGLMSDFRELDRPPIAARFDMNRSGASLTWEFCFHNQLPPLAIALIEDRDLWRFAYPETRAFSLFLRSHSYDHETWSQIFSRMAQAPQSVLAEARAIERFYDQKIAEIVPTATLKDIGIWHGIPTAHAPYAFVSDLGHELLKANPNAPFVAIIVDAYGGRTYSLRSEDNRQDVSEIAKGFGGGGHRNAAGFRVPV